MRVSVSRTLRRLAVEPPFRLVTRALIRKISSNVATRARWGVDPYPAYQFGMLEGALLAKRQGLTRITAIEFGVGSGNGLLSMQKYAQKIEKACGIEIKVVGFDTGVGLPSFIGDYRDHPDQWDEGSYLMDLTYLQRKINPTTTRLLIGNVRETVPQFLDDAEFSSIGFASFDLDIYSSTRDALNIFRSPKRKMLRQTPIYFDDIAFIVNHRWAGELLAIDEFNRTCDCVKIDEWYNITQDKPFREAYYWKKLMLAHDLEAISRFVRS